MPFLAYEVKLFVYVSDHNFFTPSCKVTVLPVLDGSGINQQYFFTQKSHHYALTTIV
jgi:hypothetical protein